MDESEGRLEAISLLIVSGCNRIDATGTKEGDYRCRFLLLCTKRTKAFKRCSPRSFTGIAYARHG